MAFCPFLSPAMDSNICNREILPSDYELLSTLEDVKKTDELLPASVLDALEFDGEVSECRICQDPSAKDVGVKLPCSHTFHKGCAFTWLCESSATCPICKQPAHPGHNHWCNNTKKVIDSYLLRMFSGYASAVSRLLPGCFPVAFRLLSVSFQWLSGFFPVPLWLLSGCSPVAFRLFSGGFRSVSGSFPVFFQLLSGRFAHAFRSSSRIATGKQPERNRKAPGKQPESNRKAIGKQSGNSRNAILMQPESRRKGTGKQPECKRKATGKQPESNRTATGMQAESKREASGKQTEVNRKTTGKQPGGNRR
jgi:hypothetical protein